MRPLADFSEDILQVRQEWNDTGKALIKKRKKEITNAETKKGEIIANPTITKMIRERCSNFLPIILKL